MDNFIDKLAQKFTAQEMIKANAAAEAEELKRTREQVKQYEACLEEMKNVNESMKESVSKLEQTLDIDFDRFGSVQVPTEGMSAMIAEGIEQIKAVQNEAKLQQDLAQEQMSGQLCDIQEKLTGQMAGQIQSIQDNMSGQLAGQIQSVQDNITGQMQEQLQGMQSGIAGQVQEQLQGMQSGIAGQVQEQLQGMQSGIAGQIYEQLQDVQNMVCGHLNEQLRGVQNNVTEQVQALQSTQNDIAGQMQGIQEAQSKVTGQILGQMQDLQEIQDAQGKLSTQITGQLQAVQERLLNQLKAERALAASGQEDKDKFTEAQIAVLKEQAAAQLDSSKELLTGQLATQKEQIVDYVHKENVKVYRNVQAVVVDESNKQYENMSSLMNRVTAKNKLMMTLIIASLACSGLSLAATVFMLLHSLGII